MSEKMYFQNEKTGRKFEIVRFDKAAGTVVLRSNLPEFPNAEFEEKYTKERFQQMGYKLVRVRTE